MMSAVRPDENVVGTPLVVCTAHIHWDPEFCDVKLVQVRVKKNKLNASQIKTNVRTDHDVGARASSAAKRSGGALSNASLVYTVAHLRRSKLVATLGRVRVPIAGRHPRRPLRL